MTQIDSKIPEGQLAEKWSNYKAHQKLVNPANKRRLDIIVVGTGLAGASAAASLGEMGFRVFNFCIQDSPRRAHSIAAQGGINAAKNYQNDGDSVYRLFYDTIKGGDYRAREANVYRLAEVSNAIIRTIHQNQRFCIIRVRKIFFVEKTIYFILYLSEIFRLHCPRHKHYTYADTNYKQKQKYSKSFFLTAFSLHICAHLPTPKLLCAIFNRHNLPEYTL